MLNAGSDVLYVGKAKNVSKRLASYARADRATPARISAHDRGDGCGRDRLDRDRNRGAAARSQPDQAAAAALQRAAARRQVVSLYPDHRRSLGAADPQASRRAVAARTLFRAVRLGRRGQPHHHRAAARVPDPLLHRLRSSKAAPGLACCTRSSAAPVPAPARSIFPATPSWCARRRDFLSGRSRVGEAAARRRDGEGLRRARIRDRGALPRPPRGAVGDPVAAGHQSAHAWRKPTCSPSIRKAAIPASRCSSSAPDRTGATAPIFPRAEKSLHAGGGAGARSWRSSTTTSRRRSSILLSHDDRGKRAAGRARSRSRPAARSKSRTPQRGEKKELVAPRADQCARGAGPQAGRHRHAEPGCCRAWRPRSVCRSAPQPHRGLRQQPHPGHQRGRRHDRGRPGRLHQEPVPQVQHPAPRPHARATTTR